MTRKMKKVKKRGGGGGIGQPSKGQAPHFWSAGKALIMMFIVLGGIVTAGGLAYRSDQLFLQDKNNTTSTIPTTLTAGGNQAMIVTSTDSMGDPLIGEDVKISLKDHEGHLHVLYEGKTKDSGSVETTIMIPQGYEEDSGKLIIEAGDETFSRDVAVTSVLESQNQAARIIISTDKPIYQPNQMVHIRTLGYEGLDLFASKKNVTIEVMDPEGNKIFKKDLLANDFGVAAMDYPLSDQLPDGNYRINAKLGSIARANKTILVKNYVLPKFKIDVDGAKTWYIASEDIVGTIKVDYFFEKHVQGLINVKAKVYRGIWETVYDKNGSLDPKGEFDLNIPAVVYAAGLDLNEGNGYMELNVSVTDTGGHNEEKSYLITIARSPISIVMISDTNLEGRDSTYTAICRYPTGLPVQNANVTFIVGDLKERIQADERGIATMTFKFNGEEKMEVVVDDGEITHTESFELKASDGLKLLPDGYYYGLGSMAKFKVFYKGDSMSSFAYYDVVSNGFTISTGHLSLSDGEGSFEVPIDRSMSPMAEVRVYKIEPDMKVIKDAVAIAVEGLGGLKVDVVPDKQIYRPGEEVKLDFRVKDAQEDGAPSILGINVVDLSVFELSDRLVGLDDVLWNLNDGYQEPTYQILDYVYLKDSYSLDYDTTTQVSRCRCGGEDVAIESSWEEQLQSASRLQNENVTNFWSFLAVIGIAGFLGLIGLSFRYKRIAVGLVLLMVVLSMGIISTLFMILQEQEPTAGGVKDRDLGDDGMVLEGDQKGPPMEKTQDLDGGIIPPFVPILGPDTYDTNDVAGGLTDESGGQQSTSSKPSHVRDYFPETWYWNPTLITDGNGNANISLMAPDSITSWGIDAIASTKDAQFGAGSANVTVFQDFFIEPDVPVSVVRNDTFPLKVLVYNYINTSKDVTVNLLVDDWYDLIDDQGTKIVNVAAGSVTNVSFNIRATQVGWKHVSVTSSAGTWTDAIKRPMLVEPDGKQSETVFNGQLEDDSMAEMNLELDPDRVPLSENVYVKLQASMEAVTVDGAENYIHFVSGCGEQSLSSLDIDILAYDALRRSDGSNEKLVEYETMVTQGIQHELQYLLEAKNGNGRGIVWFPSDKDVHPWLTSWGLITFQDARNAGFLIDDKIISDMQDWLASQQEDEGNFIFPERGLYEFNNPILKTKTVATTAYILRALIYSGYDPTSTVVTSATRYIEDHIDEHYDDPYTMSVSLLSLDGAGGDPSIRNMVSNKIMEKRIEDSINRSSHWNSGNSMISDGNDMGWEWGGRGNGGESHMIETTGYAVMALEDSGKRLMAEEGVRYLLGARTGHGYYSTQDTVVAFQALAHAGEANVKDMDVSIYAEDVLIESVHFDKENKDVTTFVDLRPYLDVVDNSTTIKMVSNGEGTLVYQVYLEQYLPWSEENRSSASELELSVDYDTLNIKVDDTISATLTMRYTGEATQLKMVLVEIKAPVGFSFVTGDLDKLVNDGTIDLYEIGPAEASLYIQDVDRGKAMTFQYSLLCNRPVKARIQGVHAFDMYNPAVDTEVLPVEVIASA